MRIEQSKITKGMWFIINQDDKVLRVVFGKAKAMIELARMKKALKDID